jgi:hypothetical protein
MRLLRGAKDKLVFQLSPREATLLLQVLKLYPRVPSAHQPLSKSGKLPDREENQRLLDESLAEQRAANKKLLEALLADPRRLRKVDAAFRLSLSRPEVEWVLQVLNDIRIGSWAILGSPEDLLGVLNAQTAPDFWAMEMAGHFQAELLEAVMGET